MTSEFIGEDKYEEWQKTHDKVEDFEYDLEDIMEKHKDVEDRYQTVAKILNSVYEKAVELEKAKDEIKAMEQFFFCLGLVKKTLEAGMFHYRKDK